MAGNCEFSGRLHFKWWWPWIINISARFLMICILQYDVFLTNIDHHHLMTSSNGNIIRVTGHLCGEFNGLRWIPHTKANDVELWCFFALHLNKRLSKQSWCWWLETPLCPLWRHRNEIRLFQITHEQSIQLLSYKVHCWKWHLRGDLWYGHWHNVITLLKVLQL